MNMLDIISENERLNALVDAYRTIRRLENENALNARLGNILIQGVDSGSLLLMLGKLGKIWWQSRRKAASESLGKNFAKLIAAHDQGGFATVDELLSGASVSETVRANGYTILARHLMNDDRAKAAEAARRAYALEPKPYRLKWLLFRLHEAGDVIKADALLDTLPPDTSFSESDARQAGQLRHEARQARRHEAKRKSGIGELAKAKSETGKLAKDNAQKQAVIQIFGRDFAGLIDMYMEDHYKVVMDFAGEPFRLREISPFSLMGRPDPELRKYVESERTTPRLKADIRKNFDQICEKSYADYFVMDNTPAMTRIAMIRGQFYSLISGEQTDFMDDHFNNNQEVKNDHINPVNEGFSERLKAQYDLFIDGILRHYDADRIFLIRSHVPYFYSENGRVQKTRHNRKLR